MSDGTARQDTALLVDLRSRAASALSLIDNMRAGKNVTRPNIWRAYDKLYELVERINLELK
jgi:hypothetical protein